MKWLTNFFNTSVGRKQLMALSGLGLAGFLVIHLSGNFLLFAQDGGKLFQAYADWLKEQPWLNAARAGLLGTLVLHLYLAFQLDSQNRKARQTDYHYKAPSDATLASRSMILTGILILVFVILHLIHFTWADHDVPGGLYGLVVAKFTHPVWSIFYIVSMLVLGGHLIHAIQSVFQTFGLRHAKYSQIIKALCMGLAAGLTVGFMSIPLFFLITKGGV